MKSFIKKTILSVFALIMAFGLATSSASAGYFTSPTSLNEHPSDCPTVMIANHTTQAGTGSDCWSTSIPTVQPGDIINVMVYYHNTGYSTAHDVTVKMSRPSGTASSFSFNGSVSDSEGDHASGSVSINLSESQSLTFGTVKWYPNQSDSSVALPNGQSGSEVFGSGLKIGNLSPDTTSGYTNQGTVIISFKVSENDSNNGQKPTVSTYIYSNRSNELGNVTLNGHYNSNNAATSTWFQYRKNGGSWITTSTQSHSATGEGDISKALTGLATGSYEYRAVAENEYGRVNGNIVSFSINRGNGGGGCNTCDCDPGCDPCDVDPDSCNDELEVATKSAEDIDENSAELVGDLEEIGSGNVERWFEWDEKRSEVEDGDGSILRISGDTDNDGEFSKSLTGLDEDTTYYFRACVEDDDGNEDCGSVKSFTTDDDNSDNDDDADLPRITTLGTIAVGSSVATVDGYYDANGCSVTTWFEYGRTSSLGSSTVSNSRGNGSGSMTYSFTSLASDTTYYYRAVGRNCEGTTRGSVKSFTTNSSATPNPTPVNLGTGGGSGNAFLQLTIDNNRDVVRSGSDIAYDVEWGNITRSTLRDLVLEVNLPDQMIAIDTDMGDITRDGHAVIVEIEELGALEKGEMTIITEIRGNLRDGDPVVAQAVMAFENPNTKVAENAIAYDSDEFSISRSTLGASLFGLDFLPGSLAGWLLLLLILLAIIILARYFMSQNQNKVTVNTNPVSVPPTPNSGTAPGNEYITYRPNPLNK